MPFINKFLKCLFALVCLTLVSGCVVLLPSPKVTDHADNHVVMETHKSFNLTSKWGRAKICREFYRHYEDVFDVLVLVHFNHEGIIRNWGAGVSGRMSVVRNTERGTGTKIFDHGRAFGSESRLKGVVQLKGYREILTGDLLHEIVHLWVFNREIIPSVIKAHWGFSSVGGQLGGFQAAEFVDLGDGQYSAGDFEPDHADGRIPYSKLEMYLAGWLPPSEVSEIWAAEDGQWLTKELTPEVLAECEIKSGPLAGTLDQDCIVQTDSNGNKIFTASEISSWNIEQIIEKLGPRTPNYEHSQKEFRIAFVFVTDNGYSLTSTGTETLDLFIEEFTAKRPITETLEFSHRETLERVYVNNFWEATNGIATLEADDLQSFRK